MKHNWFFVEPFQTATAQDVGKSAVAPHVGVITSVEGGLPVFTGRSKAPTKRDGE